MGGFGSGRFRPHRRAVEASRWLDVLQLQRGGALNAGRESGWRWTWTENGEEHTAFTFIDAKEECLTLLYRAESDGKVKGCSIELERTPCNFGKDRPWFRCPNLYCRRRCRFIYACGPYFLCRKCAGLTYAKRQVHRNPSDEARAAGVSFWDADERFMDWRKDPIRRLRYRLARTRPGSKNHQRILRRLERLERLKWAEYVHAARILGPAGMAGHLPDPSEL